VVAAGGEDPVRPEVGGQPERPLVEAHRGDPGEAVRAAGALVRPGAGDRGAQARVGAGRLPGEPGLVAGRLSRRARAGDEGGGREGGEVVGQAVAGLDGVAALGGGHVHRERPVGRDAGAEAERVADRDDHARGAGVGQEGAPAASGEPPVKSGAIFLAAGRRDEVSPWGDVPRPRGLWVSRTASGARAPAIAAPRRAASAPAAERACCLASGEGAPPAHSPRRRHPPGDRTTAARAGRR
jgi:hypothetical protein